MCGIFGIAGSTVDEHRVRGWVDTMSHRGPDAAGVLSCGNVVLAHRRLSILDTSDAANQPFCGPDGRTAVVFNGEIYNYRDLRQQLHSAGHCFRTTGDTEVLLLGYLEWGESVVERLNGMFAFAIFDARDHSLFLARDRFGKKPLFVSQLPGGGLIFSSELKALLACGLVDATVDPEAVVDYLHLNYVLSPKTMLRSVRQLPAACCGRWKEGAWSTRSYWDLAESLQASKIRLKRSSEVIDQFEELLDDATKIRLYSDVPVGAFLSGGVDSSTVVSLMRRHKSDDLHTFSVEFDEAAYDEGTFSQLASRHFHTRHHREAVHAPSLDDLAEGSRLMDVPLGDDSSIPLIQLASSARRSVTVSLTGDGADELFAGYVTYQADRLRRWLRPLRTVVAPVLAAVGQSVTEQGAKRSRRFQAEQFRRGLSRGAAAAHYAWREIGGPHRLPASATTDLLSEAGDYRPCDIFRKYHKRVRHADWLDRFLYVDCRTWLTDNILVKVDRTSMAASLECRSPFLDHRVAEFAARLPRRFKIWGAAGKPAVRKLARRLLPPTIVKRRKSGFNSPTDVWLRGSLRQSAEDLLSSGSLARFGLTWHAGIEPVWRQFLAGDRRYQYSFWGLFQLALWEKHVLSGRQP